MWTASPPSSLIPNPCYFEVFFVEQSETYNGAPSTDLTCCKG